jgi:hypothetical protein
MDFGSSGGGLLVRPTAPAAIASSGTLVERVNFQMRRHERQLRDNANCRPIELGVRRLSV